MSRQFIEKSIGVTAYLGIIHRPGKKTDIGFLKIIVVRGAVTFGLISIVLRRRFERK
ncbi:MAG: hypothetical protein H0X50_09395 [Nitrosopumilus sp.]|nr:hypothetical protein [Nitrosopumilus sp.]